MVDRCCLLFGWWLFISLF